MLKVGQHVQVIGDMEANGEDSEWVNATGVIVAIRDGVYIVDIMSGNPNPEDGSQAWFDESELQAI